MKNLSLPYLIITGLALQIASSTANASGEPWQLATTFTNPAPAAGSVFGLATTSVGLERTLISGGQEVDGQFVEAAYLFAADGTWINTFTNPNPGVGDNFGLSLAAVGNDKVLIGARSDDTGATNSGIAYLFATNGTMLTTITNPFPAPGDNFGFAVAAVGTNRVVITALNDDTGAASAGAAYLFDLKGTVLATFTNSNPGRNDFFGRSVAALGADRVIIGAYGVSTAQRIFAGQAYTFDVTGSLVATFDNPSNGLIDWFGGSVAAVGSDRVLIGAWGTDVGARNAGVAHLFTDDATLLTTITNPSPGVDDEFGRGVAGLGSAQVVIGSAGDDTGAPDAGSAYLFAASGTLLTTFTNPSPAFRDQFGFTLATIGTDRILIAAPFKDMGNNSSGAVYLYELRTPPTALELAQDLIDRVTASDISRKQPLLATLEAVLASIERDSHRSATGQLGAFVNKVKTQVNDPSLATEWIATAETLIGLLTPDSQTRPSGYVHSLTRQPDGTIRVHLKGATGKTYLLQASTNLVDWVPIGDVQPDPNGHCIYDDRVTARHRSRFYRVVEK